MGFETELDAIEWLKTKYGIISLNSEINNENSILIFDCKQINQILSNVK